MRRREPSIHNLTDLCRYGMFPPYLTLWYASGGKREEFQRLHDEVIPPTCRLLREDLLVLLNELDQHAELFSGGPRKLLAHSPASDAIFGSLFDIARKYSKSGRDGEPALKKMSLKHYYFEALRHGGETTEIGPRGLDAQMIHPGNSQPSGVYRHWISFKNEPRKMRAYILYHADGFLMRMEMWEADFDEPFTHWVLSTFPTYTSMSTTSSSTKGMGLVFTFDLPKGAIAPKYFGDTRLIAKRGFEAAALKALQSIGLPAESFMRIKA